MIGRTPSFRTKVKLLNDLENLIRENRADILNVITQYTNEAGVFSVTIELCPVEITMDPVEGKTI